MAVKTRKPQITVAKIRKDYERLNSRDEVYRLILAEQNLFHTLYGGGTKSEKARAARIWRTILKSTPRENARKASNGYIGKHKVEDWIHAKFRDAARDLSRLDGDDLKRGFKQYVDEISDWSGITKKEITHSLHMAMTEILGERKRRGRNPAKPRTAKRNPWFDVEIITPDHTVRQQLMSGTRAEVRRRVRQEYGERAQILGFKLVRNPEKPTPQYEGSIIVTHGDGRQETLPFYTYANSKAEAINIGKLRMLLRFGNPLPRGLTYRVVGLKLAKAHQNPEIDFDGKTFNRDKLDQLSATFQGEISGDEMEVDAPECVPNRTSRLGQLKKIVVRDESGDTYEIDFKGNAYLTADARKNLFCVGRGAKINGIKLPRKGDFSQLGEMIQIDYQTSKRHIENGKETYYFHETGEVDGQHPVLMVDHHGYPHIYSGNYDIGIHGIEN